MIDQDMTEIVSLTSIGIKPILCMFHLMRQIMKRIKLLPKSLQSTAFTHIKMIQRSGRDIFKSTDRAIKDFNKWW